MMQRDSDEINAQRLLQFGAQQRLISKLRKDTDSESASDGKQVVDDAPCCVYGLVTRKSLECLQDDVNEIKARINTLLWTLAGTIGLEVLLRLTGR